MTCIFSKAFWLTGLQNNNTKTSWTNHFLLGKQEKGREECVGLFDEQGGVERKG